MNIRFSQIRKSAKRECREQVSGHLGRCIGLNVLFMLPILLIMLIWLVINAVPLFSLPANGAFSPAQAAGMAGRLYSSYALLIVLLFFIVGPLVYGMQKFYIALSRGDEPGVSMLFRPFCSLRSYWAGVKLSACLMLRSWLWMLVPTVLYTVALVAATVSDGVRAAYGMGHGGAGGAVAAVVVPVATALLTVVLLLVSVKLATYMAGYFLVDEEERRGVWAATREGSRAFKGRYGSLLLFYLSFIGWYLLLFVLFLGCALLSRFGNSVMISALSAIALVCISLVLNTFIGAYVTTSFYSLCRQIIPALPRGPVDVFGVPIEDAAPAPIPVPMPEPAPKPQPAPEPEPAPKPQPAPEPEPTPEPAPEPEPMPEGADSMESYDVSPSGD